MGVNENKVYPSTASQKLAQHITIRREKMKIIVIDAVNPTIAVDYDATIVVGSQKQRVPIWEVPSVIKEAENDLLVYFTLTAFWHHLSKNCYEENSQEFQKIKVALSELLKDATIIGVDDCINPKYWALEWENAYITDGNEHIDAPLRKALSKVFRREKEGFNILLKTLRHLPKLDN